jgi:hypothetical protein
VDIAVGIVAGLLVLLGIVWLLLGRRGGARHLAAWEEAAADLSLQLRGDRIEGTHEGVELVVRTVAMDSGQIGTEVQASHPERLRVTAASGPVALDLGDPETPLALRGELEDLLAVLDRDTRVDLVSTEGLRLESGKVWWIWPGVETHSIRLRKRMLRAAEMARGTAPASRVRRLAERVHDADEPDTLRAKALTALVETHPDHDDTTGVCLQLIRQAGEAPVLRGPALLALARRRVPIVQRAAMDFQRDPALQDYATEALAQLRAPPRPR